MSRPFGSKNKAGKTVKQAIEKHFHKVNKDGKYLDKLSRTHPAVYMGVVGKLVPAELKASVEHHVIDLGQAMLEARQRLDDSNIIDITPDDNPLITLDNDKLNDLLD